MKKNLLEAMKADVLALFSESKFDLLDISDGTTHDKDGNAVRFIRIEAEIPKGNNIFSRCRFPVKIVDGKTKIASSDLENADYLVSFSGLDITYIDDKGNVYFKADDYEVTEAE